MKIGPFERSCPERSQASKQTQFVRACGVLIEGSKTSHPRQQITPTLGRNVTTAWSSNLHPYGCYTLRPSFLMAPAPFFRHSTFDVGGGALVATLYSSNTLLQQQQRQQLPAVLVQVPTNLWMNGCCRGGSAARTFGLFCVSSSQLPVQ